MLVYKNRTWYQRMPASAVTVDAFVSFARFTSARFCHLCYRSLVGKLPAPIVVCGHASTGVGQPMLRRPLRTTHALSAWRAMVTYTHAWRVPDTRRPSHEVSSCPTCDTSNFYTETGPPRINTLPSPASRKGVSDACVAFYGASKQMSTATKYFHNVGKLSKHNQKWGGSDADSTSADQCWSSLAPHCRNWPEFGRIRAEVGRAQPDVVDPARRRPNATQFWSMPASTWPNAAQI